MTTNLEHLASNPFEVENLVYIRRMEADEVEGALPPNALEDIARPDELFALHNAMGERIGVVEGREAAFEAARAHSLLPASVH